jgi:hypothetical protein
VGRPILAAGRFSAGLDALERASAGRIACPPGAKPAKPESLLYSRDPRPPLLNGPASFVGVAQYQIFQIQEVLRLKLLPGPLARRRQFDADEIAYLPVYAVAHNAGQLIAGTVDLYMRTYGYRYLELQTHSRWRDIFQQSSRFAFMARRFFPTNLYQIGAQHPDFSAWSLHASYIDAIGLSH